VAARVAAPAAATWVLTGGVALIDVPTLARELAQADPPTVIDVRWRLGGPPGRDAYDEAHIPGAAFLDLDLQLCGVPDTRGRHPLPEPATLQRALRAAGVRTGHPVVVYDAGETQAAARLWWTLRWAGHDNVSVLDGGFAAWMAAGRPTEPGSARPRPGTIAVRPGQVPVLDAGAAAELARSGVLIDARVAERYRGETEPIDPVAGHIPGAVNLPAARLTDGDGRLLPPARLREVFAEVGATVGRPVGAYCGSGVTAAQTMLALQEAGLDGSLFVGSWSNWVADPSRPVAIGDAP
jgi:thiosulfate/3-mercaptopyruvate sulfurtransferase